MQNVLLQQLMTALSILYPSNTDLSPCYITFSIHLVIKMVGLWVFVGICVISDRVNYTKTH